MNASRERGAYQLLIEQKLRSVLRTVAGAPGLMSPEGTEDAWCANHFLRPHRFYR
jgi:hypothetical protein